MSTYTDPCPEAEFIFDPMVVNQVSHKNRGRKKRTPLIQNGNNINPRVNARVQLFYDNTSPIDAILQVMMNAYYFYSAFKNFCCDPKVGTDFFQTVHALSESRNKKIYIHKRQNILLEIASKTGDRIYCRENIAVYYGKLLKNDYSLSVTVVCDFCNAEKIHNFTSLEVDNLNTNLSSFCLDQYKNGLCREHPKYACSIKKKGN